MFSTLLVVHLVSINASHCYFESNVRSNEAKHEITVKMLSLLSQVPSTEERTAVYSSLSTHNVMQPTQLSV